MGICFYFLERSVPLKKRKKFTRAFLICIMLLLFTQVAFASSTANEEETKQLIEQAEKDVKEANDKADKRAQEAYENLKDNKMEFMDITTPRGPDYIDPVEFMDNMTLKGTILFYRLRYSLRTVYQLLIFCCIFIGAMIVLAARKNKIMRKMGYGIGIGLPILILLLMYWPAIRQFLGL